MLKVIKLIIIFLFVLFVVIGLSLISGIKIDSFSLGNFSVSKFYLKFDKKLILDVDKLTFDTSLISSNDSSSSNLDIVDLLSKIKTALSLFKRIDIERIKIGDEEFTITLNEDNLYLDNKDVNIATSLDINSSQIFLNVYSIYIKEIGLTLYGDSKIDLSKNVFNFFGKYQYEEMQGEVNAQIANNILDFYVNTTKAITSLKFLKKYISLDSVAEEWMYDNVEGDINLQYLYGKVDLLKKEPIMDSIKGKATIKNAKIRFNPDAKTVNTDELTIDYKEDTLSFSLLEPKYNESKIYGSKVYITDLTSLEKGTVYVDLVSDSVLNKDILEILTAYKIKLPLIQKSGKLDSRLILKIPYEASRKMDVNGIFRLQDANMKLNNFEFFAKEADILLKDTTVTIEKSHLLYKKMLETDLSLIIDTKNSLAKGIADINKFEIVSKNSSIINIKKLNTNLDIDFKESSKINIDAIGTKLDIKKEYIDIDIADLKKVFSYSNLLQSTGIKEGDLKVQFFDNDKIDFGVNASGLDLPFSKEGVKVNKLSANGTIRGNSTTIKTNDKDIEILLKEGENPLLKLSNIDLLVSGNKENKKEEKLPNIDLNLKNSFIVLDEKHKYKTSWANISIKNSKVNFEGEALYLDLPISKDSKQIRNFDIKGNYENKILTLENIKKDLKLKYEVNKDKITMDLDGYDVIYDSNQEEDKTSNTSYHINGKNSNIIINEKYIAKANNYKFVFENHKTDIDLKYKNTTFMYHKDFAGQIKIDSKNMNDEFLNALIGKNLIKGGIVNLTADGKDGKINGVANLNDTRIVDLAILNNLLILINTSPAIINPFLAIPSVVGMATNDGFNLNGYRITEGRVDFSYDFDNKFLNMHKINTKGNGIDFDGFATIDFKNSNVDSKLRLVFMKDYSKIVGSIPVINYVLLGDEKRVDTEVQIYGTLDEPKYKTKLVEEGVVAPVNFLKRVITSPVKILETIGDSLGDKKSE